MTTKITIMNHGPRPVEVTPINPAGVFDGGPAKRVLEPGEFVSEMFVYDGRQYLVTEL